MAMPVLLPPRYGGLENGKSVFKLTYYNLQMELFAGTLVLKAEVMLMAALIKRISVVSVLLAAMFVFIGIVAYADTFLPPEPFEIWSEDETTVFRWDPGPADNWRGTAQAGVYRNGELVYSVENLPIMGESAGSFMFSTDFRFMVFRPSVSQIAALGFFDNGVLLRSYRIDELVRDMSVVTYSVTTASWEAWPGRYFNTADNTLTITTRDNITYVFDITTGDIIYDTAGDTPFVPHREDSFGFFLHEGSLPLWAQGSRERETLIIISNLDDLYVPACFYCLAKQELLDAMSASTDDDDTVITDMPNEEHTDSIPTDLLIGIIVVALCSLTVIFLIVFNRKKSS